MQDDLFNPLDEEEQIAEQQAHDEVRLAAAGLQRPIRDLPTLGPAAACARNATVRQAIELMHQRRLGYILVVEQGRLLGIFTERDVLTKVAGREVDIDRVTVGTLMTTDPECLSADDELVYALNQMSLGGYRHIPLLDDDGRPIGVVAMRHIVDYLVSLFPRDVLNLPPVPPLGIPQVREGA
jgi:signal-transduction protein with cAMP-binding, CBS, and nucleotidyltransferase domain